MIKLQLDDGGEYLLGYAKGRLHHLSSLRKSLGVPVLDRWYALDSGELVHIVSASIGDTIRIVAANKYLALLPMPDPTPYRSLFLDTGFGAPLSKIQPPYIPPSPPNQGIGSVFTSIVYDYSQYDFNTSHGKVGSLGQVHDGVGTILFSLGGTFTSVVRGDGAIENNSTNYAFDGGDNASIGFFNGGRVFGALDPSDNYNNETAFAIHAYQFQDQASANLAAANSAYNAALASYLATYNATSGARLQVTMSDGDVVAFLPRKTNDGSTFSPSFSGSWLGEEGTLITTGNFPFAVPPDTQSSLTGATAKAREKARLKINGTNAINFLKSGVLPSLGANDWGALAKASALASSLPRALSPFSAALTTAEVPSFTNLGPVNTVYGPITVTRGIHMSYVDADGVLQQDDVTGTWTQRSIKVGTVYYVTNSYVNFPIFSPVNGSSLFTLLQAQEGPMSDFSSVLGSVIDGASVIGNNADSEFGVPGDPTTNVGFPDTSSDLVFSTADLYAEYLDAMKPVDVNTLPTPPPPRPPYSPNWLSTSMVPSEIVSFIPFSPVLNDEDLGMFGLTTGATKVAVYGVAKFKYNIDGSFSFVEWIDNPQTLSMVDDGGSAIPWPGSNCIVRYSRFDWKDARDFASAQRKAILNPVTTINKFLHLIQSAMGI